MARKGGWDYETPSEIARGWWDALIANSPALVVLVIVFLVLFTA